MSLTDNPEQFSTLVNIIARLRGPDGCPWDRQQTHTSLCGNLLGECYEVLEALDEGNPEKLAEEMGDLLLQIVLHAQIAADNGEFEIGDVIRKINAKLVRRHPHIFGSRTVKDAGEVMINWEALKEEERGEDASMLEGIPAPMPALALSEEIQKRVARVGFDWEDVDGVIDKLAEEVAEFKHAGDQGEKEREFGDLLFTLVNVARRLGVDSEAALRETNRRFRRRFAAMEALCHQRGLKFAGLSFAEQNALWEEAKMKLDDTGRGERI